MEKETKQIEINIDRFIADRIYNNEIYSKKFPSSFKQRWNAGTLNLNAKTAMVERLGFKTKTVVLVG